MHNQLNRNRDDLKIVPKRIVPLYKSPIAISIISKVILSQLSPESREVQKLPKNSIDSSVVPKLSSNLFEMNQFQQSQHKDDVLSIEIPFAPKENQIIETKTEIVQNKIENNYKRPSIIWIGYGKLTPYLNDPGVSYIECLGEGIPINVVKYGKSQQTFLSLTEEEIRAFFNVISDRVRIPLIEGVFRVIVDNFLLNATISEGTGSTFLIKKDSFSL